MRAEMQPRQCKSLKTGRRDRCEYNSHLSVHQSSHVVSSSSAFSPGFLCDCTEARDHNSPIMALDRSH